MPYKVLIVDDSKLARMALMKVIKGLRPDWERIEATNADEALAIVKQSPVDLAFLDFNMPGRDGLSLAAEFHELDPRMPVAVISANVQREVVARAANAGAGFLAKPITEQSVGDFLVEAERRLKESDQVTASTTILTELELDALTELVNIGVSRAANSLREMIGEQVLLSVPNVRLVSRSEAVTTLQAREEGHLVAVHQIFEGDITGRALLIFPETKSLELVRAVTGGELPLEEIIDLEQEALAETGNIILNGCLATIANMLGRSLKTSLPEILRGDGLALLNLAPPPAAGDVVMFLYIDFAVNKRDISGYVAMLMDLPSLVSLKGLLDEYIQRATGETPPSDARS